MDSNRRAELIEKRKALQQELRRARSNECLFRLRQNGLTPAVVPEQQVAVVLSRFNHVPTRDERVQWTEIAFPICSAWSTDAERDELVRQALVKHAAGADVTVYWRPDLPLVRLKAHQLVTKIGVVLDQATETWLFSECADWLVENSEFDLEVCSSCNLLRRS